MPMNLEQIKEYKDLLRRHRELLIEYEKILENFPNDENLSEILPTYPMFPLIIERRCAFAEHESSYIGFFMGPGERNIGLKELRDFTKDAKDLIIVDPYIFSGPRSVADEVAQDLVKSARIDGKKLKRIHIVYDQSNVTNAVKKSITNKIEANSVHLTIAHSEILHDRVWIADRARALAVGTSLNGYWKQGCVFTSASENRS